MRLKKHVLGIIGKALEKHGFVYDKDISDSGAWAFTRSVNSITQEVCIQKSNFQQAFYLRSGTSAWLSREQLGPRDATKIVPKERLPQDQYFEGLLLSNYLWGYNTEDELKATLTELASIIEDHLIDHLNEMSIEDEILPTKEMVDKLYTSYEELNEKFIIENNLGVNQISEESARQWFEVIGEKIIETKDENYEDVKNMLVEMAAFLGQQLRKEMGGEWQRGINDLRRINIRDLNGHIFIDYSALFNCVEMWKYQDIDYCREFYLIVLANKAPLTMEQDTEIMRRQSELGSLMKKTR